MIHPPALLHKLFSIVCPIIILIISSSCLSKHSSSRSSRKAYYGSVCNSSVKCDIHSLLMCEENVCQCLYPDAMVYNPDLGTCTSLVNEICGYLETKRVFINCVPNAHCDQQQGVCRCTQGYIEGGERHCLKQKSFGESCHSDNECMSELSLTCFEEVCQCDPNLQAPHIITANNLSNTVQEQYITKCVSLADLPCTAKTGCVKKATCVSETENEAIVSSSTTFGWMQPGICRCDNGYEIDGRRQCLGKYGSHCDVLANISCVEKFQCMDGICHCKYPDDQIFQADIGECVSLVGGPCSETNGNDDVDNANGAMDDDEGHCDKFMECKNLTCTCKNGFVENLDRECDLSYGQSCTGETMSKCDAAVGLYCVDGRCSCKDKRKEYNVKTGKCEGKTGSSCEMSSSVSGKVISNLKVNDRMLSCSENMKCQASRTQLEDITSTGFCTLSKGGDGGKGQYLQHDGMHSGNRQTFNDDSSDYY